MFYLKKYSCFNAVWLIVLSFTLLTVQGFCQKETVSTNPIKKSISSIIHFSNEDGIYTAKDKKISFELRLQNEINEKQAGMMNVDIKNATGTSVYHEEDAISLKSKGSTNKKIKFSNTALQSGFYYILVAVKTNYFSDTFRYSFGYEPTQVQSKLSIPSDFVNFWNEAKQELNAINPNYQIVKKGDLGKGAVQVYSVEFKSVGNAIITGWLTVPTKKGKYPVLYRICDYKSNLQPEARRDFAVFDLNIRGVGASAPAYNIDFEHYNLYKLNDKKKYIYRGAYMDCLRGLDFIFKNAAAYKLNDAKIIILGSGQGASLAAVCAALDTRVKGLAMERPLHLGIRELISYGDNTKSTDWPYSAFKNYYSSRSGGMSKDIFLNTWDYFDPLNFAPYISCPVLMGYTLRSTTTPPQAVYAFLNQLRVTKDTHVCEECSNNMDKGYYGFQETWIKEIFKQP